MGTETTRARGRGRGRDSKDRTAGSSIGRRTGRQAGWKTWAITAIAAVGTLAGIATPAAADTLVTNLGEATSSGLELSRKEYAVPFRTGNNGSGYRLESISLDYKTGRNTLYDLVYVDVFPSQDPVVGERPRSSGQVAHLTTHQVAQQGPVAGMNKYYVRTRGFGGEPITSVHLEPATWYWVRIFAANSSTAAELQTTSSNRQSGGGGDWQIKNWILGKPDTSSDASYARNSAKVKLQVEGRSNPRSSSRSTTRVERRAPAQRSISGSASTGRHKER